MQAQLKNNALTLRDRTYNLLTQAKDYGAFATDDFTGTEQNPTHYDSLESIHTQIHGRPAIMDIWASSIMRRTIPSFGCITSTCVISAHLYVETHLMSVE
jgi:hypothetical protein